jgi:phage terminase large subunit-like protein
MIAPAKPDPVTAKWMRDASDELAVRNGCWFDEERGKFVVNWFRDYLRFYEGECAGKPFELDPARGGMEWQYELVMRLFGWVQQSGPEDWNRTIRRFKRLSLWAAKKNGKSPLLAGLCCYMAFADGAPGEKCFPTAKNGKQIKQNVVQHIHEMIRQSPELSATCKLNKVEGRVFDESTRSSIVPLSSENIATQQANEGINGHTFVDEVHVVDKAHIGRIDRAGISHPEPLHIETSTVGDDPESYGRGAFDRATAVIEGRSDDWETLAIIYAAPQDARDAEIHADPLKYGRMANPSMGKLVMPSEFLSDYNRSKKSLSEFARFKMYRLNIWQQSTNPWISLHDWAQCPSSKSPLVPGVHTVASFDLSSVTDFTAWMVYQKDGEQSRCRGHYWITPKRAKELAGQFEIPVLEWVNEGWITLSNDDRIVYSQVHKRMEADIVEYKIGHVGYDRRFSGDTVDFLRNDQGVETVELAQGARTLGTACRELEAMVVARQLDTGGDPVLSWMIGNTSVKRDSNDGIMPVKAPGGTRKHIDGVVALVMAICVRMVVPSSPKRTGRVAFA